ncbi:MAG: IPT/TIG domain-containing protein [Deltaproteobacteria bacterium]|nr:IPT/TIG domain-containing protein [Deltaproteobacteria bacterium]
MNRRFVLRQIETPLAFVAMLFAASFGCAGETSILNDVSPSFGPRGTEVTIRGRAFGLGGARSRVTFDGTNAAVLQWTETEIVALVPPKANYGDAQIRVERPGADSTSRSFRVTEYAPVRRSPTDLPPVNASPGPFVPDGDCSAGKICITKISGAPGTLVLGVVADAIGFATGVAFELAFDPAVLRLRSAKRGSAFSAPVVSHAAEAAPGQLLAGIAEVKRNGIRGKQIDSSRMLWVFTFDLLSTGRTAITFTPGTRDARSASNGVLPVSWIGGNLEAADTATGL